MQLPVGSLPNWLGVGLVALTAATFDASQAANCLGPAPVTELGEIANPSPALVLSKNNRLERLAYDGPEIRYMRPRITVSGQPGARWTLAIHDSQMRVLQTFSDLDFVGRSHAWAARMQHRELFATLSDLENPQDLSIIIDNVLVLPERSGTTFYSVQADDPSQAAWLPLFNENVDFKDRRLGQSVGMLLIATGSKPKACTGVAVARDLVLTNWHCAPTLLATIDGVVEIPDQFWTKDHCSNTMVDFSWDGDAISGDFSCTKVVAKSRDLDYALLRVAPDGRDRTVPIARLRTTRPRGGVLKLVHHPLADQKQITVNCQFGVNRSRTSWLGGRAGTEFEHVCDSEAGSSGAPVFDSEGFVIGLHHLGFDRNKTTCKPIDAVNKAVWMDVILNDIKKQLSIMPKDLGFIVDQH